MINKIYIFFIKITLFININQFRLLLNKAFNNKVDPKFGKSVSENSA